MGFVLSMFVYIYILAILVASFHTENQMGLIYDMEYNLGAITVLRNNDQDLRNTL
jgi:phosphate starvation-inducible membrane PsiE